ncbi:SCP-like protein [Teladorsagia circumcincta]|uniref:SCP-like protein n=1 Tax=Teladorsagia circumcincta TaxID=45464 RepID=A0A2G9TYE7_TELCI|nr:SCP-like protein [Teladorsagia circumcincta]
MVPTRTAATLPSPMTEVIRARIIDIHNYRRSRLARGLVPNGPSGKTLDEGMNIYELAYNMNLEQEAQKYADTCPSMGSPLASRKSIGENFGMIPSSFATTYYDAVNKAMRLFWNVIRRNSINDDMLFTDQLWHKQPALLRFTQMAWASTYQVGCGVRLCADNYVVVCRYYPR